MKVYSNSIVYTADDEEPDCGMCDNCDSDLCNKCGPDYWWHYYERVEDYNEPDFSDN